MAENLLRNGDFSELWSKDDPLCHRALAIVNGEVEPRDIGNIFTPPGWLVWFVHKPGDWDQPEVRDAWDEEHGGDPRRVRSNPKATALFTFYRKHDAGLLQQVKVIPGRRYQLTGYPQAWSNHDDIEGGHPDDPRWSDGAGRRIIAWEIGDVPDEGLPKAQEDAKRNFWFHVGIDPSGGTNADSFEIEWCKGWHVYNDYRQQLSIEVQAESEYLTVFVASRTEWPFKHNDAYWDDISLVEVDPPPTREYERTYVLLPNMDPFNPAEQARISTLNPGKTVGPSADDAAIGHPFLKQTTIISYQPQTWGGKDAIEDFWRVYYDFPQPGDVIEYREDHEPPPPNPWLLGQRDPEWANVPLGYDGCSLTIGQAGCFVSSLGMGQRYYDIQDDATPYSVDEQLGPAGYVDCNVNWRGNPEHVADVLRLKISDGTATDAINHMAVRGCAMAEVLPATREHFVLVYDSDDGYTCLDPWPIVTLPDGSLQYGEGRPFVLLEAQSWRIVEKVEPTPPVGDTTGNTGLHQQTLVGGWDQFVRDLHPSVMKFFQIEPTLSCRVLSPDTAVVYRHFVPDQGKYINNMGAFIDLFRDSLYAICNQFAQHQPAFSTPYLYVESLNETYATGDPAMQQFIDTDLNFIDELAKTGLPVAPIPYCAAVGNIGETEYHKLLGLGRACEAAGGAFGYHNYWWANQQESGLDSWWPWHCGRWQGLDEYFVSNGIHVKYFGGESGGVGSVNGQHLNPVAGWLHPECYKGNWPRFLADILEADSRESAWNASHGNRFLGKVLFTSGDGTGWGTFQIRAAQMAAIAAGLKALYG